MCRTPPLNQNVINDFITSGMWKNNEKVIFAKHLNFENDFGIEDYHKVMTIDEFGMVRTYTKETTPIQRDWSTGYMLS